MRRTLLALALSTAVLAAPATVDAHPGKPPLPRCVPTVNVRNNGTIVLRFRGTVAECIPIWQTWGSPTDTITWEWINANFVITSISTRRGVTTIVGHLFP